ncbi:hypothetical protein [Streptomyces gobitricini]|uniref:Uncharacterized protein n=1 Tax=Streptomyces gobitricini TaxID=68211 RepID=A0ABP5YSM9_9ACTN
MKRGLAEILGTHRSEHQRITSLVQSTDQAAHHEIGVAAALVTTWITLRKGDRRCSPPRPTSTAWPSSNDTST